MKKLLANTAHHDSKEHHSKPHLKYDPALNPAPAPDLGPLFSTLS
ncbi:hypothetical protein [Pelobacter propionicus]|nr:hypothetical protein [Pelobacter propionicus]